MGRPTIIAGNWKMYKTLEEAVIFVETLTASLVDSQADVILAAPSVHLAFLAKAVEGTKIQIAAQNMHEAEEGAFTGEISGGMLKDIGISTVILGHSERRQIFLENDALVNKKLKAALAVDLKPILCIGESFEERESGRMEEVLRSQLEGSLEGLTSDNLRQMVLAYEPVWAIGTGKTATAAMAQEAHVFCRSVIGKILGQDFAQKIPILYGGSVKPENVKSLMDESDIDGVLVGGASLDVISFNQIVHFDVLSEV